MYCNLLFLLLQLSSVAASSALQLILDAECLKQHAASCKLGNTRHCQPAVARFTYDEMNGNWSFRCYASQELEYKKTDNGCVDSCGDFAACSGAVGASAVSIDAEQELALLYLNVQPQTCKMNVRKSYIICSKKHTENTFQPGLLRLLLLLLAVAAAVAAVDGAAAVCGAADVAAATGISAAASLLLLQLLLLLSGLLLYMLLLRLCCCSCLGCCCICCCC